MPDRAAVIAEARPWIGTPFVHQGSVRGAGCDCAGLIKGVGVACGAVRVDPQEWKRLAAYGRQPYPPRMRAVLARFLRPIAADEADIGDVCWMQWRENVPTHLAILAAHDGRATLIHALSDEGRVVEHGFTPEWRSRVTQWWRYPGLEI